MRNIKLVIFDLDGTIINAYTAINLSLNFTMQKMGYPRRSALAIRQAVGWGDKNLIRPFVEKKDLSKALTIYRRHHKRALPDKSRLLPGARYLLSGLKRKGFKLAVASNRPTKFSWILIRSLKLDQYFDYVLCADKLKRGKPAPEILNKIISKFRLQKKQVLYVGDMAIDAQAGRAAKLRTIIITTGSSSAREIRKERPYRVIHKLSELSKLLI